MIYEGNENSPAALNTEDGLASAGDGEVGYVTGLVVEAGGQLPAGS